MKIAVSHLNAHSPLVTSAEVDKATHFVVISHLSPAAPLTAQWAHEQSAHGSKDGMCTWAQQHESSLTKANCLQPLLGP